MRGSNTPGVADRPRQLYAPIVVGATAYRQATIWVPHGRHAGWHEQVPPFSNCPAEPYIFVQPTGAINRPGAAFDDAT